MKTILLYMLTILPIFSFAQYQVDIRFPHPEWDVYKNKPKGEKLNVSVYTQTRNGKRLLETFSFNSKGIVENEQWYKQNGNISMTVERRYNDSNQIISRRIIVNNKTHNLYHYSYDNQSLVTQASVYSKDTLKPFRITEYKYTLGNKYKLIAGYNSDKKQLYRYEYDYHENGSHKESRYYKKNKLKNTWTFDCSTTGELVTPKTINIFKNRTYKADSSFTEVYENMVKRKPSRTIVSSTSDGRVLENSVYDVKGNLKSKSVYEYNTEKKLVKHLIYKHHSTSPKTVEIYEYGNDSNLSTCIRLSSSGDVKYRRTYTYN